VRIDLEYWRSSVDDMLTFELSDGRGNWKISLAAVMSIFRAGICKCKCQCQFDFYAIRRRGTSIRLLIGLRLLSSLSALVLNH
jgi:hypothetical protein